MPKLVQSRIQTNVAIRPCWISFEQEDGSPTEISREGNKSGQRTLGDLPIRVGTGRKSSLLHGLWLIAEQKYKYIETGWGMGQRIYEAPLPIEKRAEVSEPVGGKSRTNLEVGGQDCEYLLSIVC